MAEFVRFWRGNATEIDARKVTDGQLVYNTEAGLSYIDVENKRIPLNTDYVFVPSQVNTPTQNSQLLQRMIDTCSNNGGGTIYIPSGIYKFASTGKAGYSSGQDYCVKMKSNVRIIGNGDSTILKPVGTYQGGLDMFYENTYRETQKEFYTRNCIFENFQIDSIDSHSNNYTTAGKGFMLNLIDNCHWNNITVKNTDGTGIGVDCPVNCSIVNCRAIGCGKGVTSGQGHGASGIGIGFGYSNSESMVIRDCVCEKNRNYGIFYEHQRRFQPQLYGAKTNKGLFIDSCSCTENYRNFGAERAVNVHIRNCYSNKAETHGYSVINSELCSISGCISNVETAGSYVISCVANEGNEKTTATKDISISDCVSKYSTSGIKLFHAASNGITMERIAIHGNAIFAPKNEALYESGEINNLLVLGNMSESSKLTLNSTGIGHVSKGNTWDK